MIVVKRAAPELRSLTYIHTHHRMNTKLLLKLPLQLDTFITHLCYSHRVISIPVTVYIIEAIIAWTLVYQSWSCLFITRHINKYCLQIGFSQIAFRSWQRFSSFRPTHPSLPPPPKRRGWKGANQILDNPWQKK